MARLHARTNAEAHLYMDLRPCSCGEPQFDRRSAVITDGGVLCSRYAGPCRGCGAPRAFVFELPDTVRPIGDRVEFGGSDPSRLLDPGEWMAVSTERAKRQPGTQEDLDFARAALEEVLKFVPPNADRVPDGAFVTERGRAVRDAEPGRFRRVRIEAVLSAWRDILARYAAEAAGGSSGPATSGSTAASRALIVPGSTAAASGSTAAARTAAAPGSTAAAPTATGTALLAEQPLAVLVEALATTAAKQEGFEGVELRRHAADLAGQIQTALRMFQIKAAEIRQRTKSSADVERLLDAIAQTDTEAGRTIAAHRADIATLFGGLDLAQLSNSLQTLVGWLRDPANANPASMQQLLAQLQATVASPGGDKNN